MQNLENDMEDLFKRAAENYAPQKGKGDWESIAKRISDKSDLPENAVLLRSKKNKSVIATALLLIFVSLAWLVFQHYNSDKSFVGEVNHLSKDANNVLEQSKINNTKPAISIGKNAFTIVPKKDKSENYKELISASANRRVKVTAGISSAFYSIGNINLVNQEGYENYEIIQKTPGYGAYVFPIENFKEYSEGSSLEISKNKTIEGEKILKENENASIKKNKKVLPTKIFQKDKGLYVGFIAGTDFSKVRSGSYNNTGIDLGALLGYRVNTKLSFESGIIFDKKNYKSEGRNFRTDKVSSMMPAGMIINSLESKSSLIEIPLKAKYDFYKKSKSDLFLAAGISAYILTKEKNNYNASMNGNDYKISWTYKTNNYKIPAVANISFGYEHTVYRNIDIRIEPFIKIPLQGIGVGSLPVTSAGLQIGITSRLK